MAQKILFLSTRDSDKASITASSAITGLPVTNIQDQEPSRVWRATVPGFLVDFTFPTAIAANAAAFEWPQGSLSSSATVLFIGYATANDMATSGPRLIDSGTKSVWPGAIKHTDPDWGPEVGLIQVTNTVATRFWRVWFQDAASPNGYADIGRIAVGKAVQFRNDPRIDGSMGFISIDVQEPNGYGQTFTDPRPFQQRQFELAWTTIDGKALMEDVSELARLRGQAGDVFVFMQPDETTYFHKYSMQALFENVQKFIPQQTYIPGTDGTARMGWSFNATMTQKL